MLRIWRGGWKDHYGFHRCGRWFVALPVMLEAAYLVALGQWARHGFQGG